MVGAQKPEQAKLGVGGKMLGNPPEDACSADPPIVITHIAQDDCEWYLRHLVSLSPSLTPPGRPLVSTAGRTTALFRTRHASPMTATIGKRRRTVSTRKNDVKFSQPRKWTTRHIRILPEDGTR